jgi:hypothetical protein
MLKMPLKKLFGLYLKQGLAGQVLWNNRNRLLGWRRKNHCSRAGGDLSMEKITGCRNQQILTCKMQCIMVSKVIFYFFIYLLIFFFIIGWLHNTLITGVFCYGADGTVVWAKFNYPGSWNNGEISRSFQEKLINSTKTIPGTGVVADSAFPVCDGMFGHIIMPMKVGDLERASPECHAGLIAMSNAITSIRQAAEWGMGSTVKCFRRLLMPLPFNPVVRGRRIENIYRLYNLQVQRTGISQIRSVFCS